MDRPVFCASFPSPLAPAHPELWALEGGQGDGSIIVYRIPLAVPQLKYLARNVLFERESKVFGELVGPQTEDSKDASKSEAASIVLKGYLSNLLQLPLKKAF